MRERFVLGVSLRELGRVAPDQVGDAVLEATLAAAEEDVLRVEGRALPARLDEEAPALLLGHARHLAEERHAGAHRQADLALERRLARSLARAIFGVVADRDERIARRIPGLEVDAVQDSDEAVAPRREESVEAGAVLGRRDLACVGRR